MGVEVLTVLRYSHIRDFHLNLIAPDVAHRALNIVLLKWLIHGDKDFLIILENVSKLMQKNEKIFDNLNR